MTSTLLDASTKMNVYRGMTALHRGATTITLSSISARPKSQWWTTRETGCPLSQLSSKDRKWRGWSTLKYLVVQNNKNCPCNTDAIFWKEHSREFFLPRLRSLSVSNDSFYDGQKPASSSSDKDRCIFHKQSNAVVDGT